MKIAIPTEDGFTVSRNFTPATGFLVSNIQSGEVVRQEMRWNPDSEIITSEKRPFQNLFDCEKVIVREIDFDQSNYFQLQKKEVIKTKELIITNVLMQYLSTSLLKEANTCCSP